MIVTGAHANVTHRRDVVAYRRGGSLSVGRDYYYTQDNRADIPGASLGQPFTFNPGDHLLLAVAGLIAGSGNRFSTKWQEDAAGYSQFFQGDNELTIAAHGIGFWQSATTGANGLWASSVSYGYGHRATIIYIDRENGLGRWTKVAQDGIEPVFDTFDSVAPMTQGGSWDDAAIGSVTIDLGFNSHWIEHGAVRAVRWPAGEAPPISTVDTAMEWMWHEWCENNRFVLYPWL